VGLLHRGAPLGIDRLGRARAADYAESDDSGVGGVSYPPDVCPRGSLLCYLGPGRQRDFVQKAERRLSRRRVVADTGVPLVLLRLCSGQSASAGVDQAQACARRNSIRICSVRVRMPPWWAGVGSHTQEEGSEADWRG